VKKILVALSVILFLTPFVLATGPTPTYTGYAGGYGVGAPQGMGTAIPGQGQLAVQYGTQGSHLIWLAPAAASINAFATITIATATISTPLLPPTTTMTLAQGSFTNEITPRNLVFVSSCVYNTTAYIKGQAIVTGTDLFGNTQSETILFSTGTTASTGIPGYLGIGNYAYRSVTSVVVSFSSTTYNSAAPSSLIIYMGSGVKLGMNCQPDAQTQIQPVNEAGSLSTSYTAVLSPYWTMQFNSAPNGSNNYSVDVQPRMK
jgi:hypothetical protein